MQAARDHREHQLRWWEKRDEREDRKIMQNGGVETTGGETTRWRDENERVVKEKSGVEMIRKNKKRQEDRNRPIGEDTGPVDDNEKNTIQKEGDIRNCQRKKGRQRKSARWMKEKEG